MTAKRARSALPGLVGPAAESNPAGSDAPLFAYGTLTDPAFVARLLERPVTAEAGELLDFLLAEPVGFGYPVVFAAPGERTAGVLYHHLGPEDWRRLDAYEGVGEGLYFRELAAVEPAAGGAAEPAWVYLPTGLTVRRFSR